MIDPDLVPILIRLDGRDWMSGVYVRRQRVIGNLTVLFTQYPGSRGSLDDALALIQADLIMAAEGQTSGAVELDGIEYSWVFPPQW